MYKLMTAILVSMLFAVPAFAIVNPANNHDYQLTPWLPWDEAESYAQSLGGHLAIINDVDELNWILDTFGTPETTVWIGGRNFSSPDWTWANGDLVSYTNWNVGEPDGYFPGGEEQFTAMWMITDATDETTPFLARRGRWFDVTNSPPRIGIMEISSRSEPVPEPTGAALTGIALVFGVFASSGSRRRVRDRLE